jgi:predicted nucleic acid-binding protein
MTGPEHIYWDSCVFIRYLTENPNDYLDDIARYITDARKGIRKIYFSTICYAEIRQRFLRKTKFPSIQQFFADFSGAFIPIDPNPNILIAAGEIRDVEPVNPSDPSTDRHRVIGTADAVHLMTCLHLRDVLGVSEVVFHSFDAGRGSTWEGKCVPIIGFERWYPPELRAGHIARVCSLPRSEPIYPEEDLLSGRHLDLKRSSRRSILK